jgi:hypothetical protein
VLAVKTLTRPPQTPVRPRAVAEAPRRWPRWLAVIAAIVLLLLLVVGVVWVLNIEPLATGPERYGIRGRSRAVTTRDVDALGTTGRVQTLQMRPGMTFRYGFSITNTGRVPITIVNAGSTGQQDVSTTLVEANLSLERAPGLKQFGPFAPFGLGPGETAGLMMQVRVSPHACSGKGSSTTWYEEPVTYRVFGITRHAEVPTGTEIRLVGTDATSC